MGVHKLSNNIFFRTDSNETIGMGHVMRCLAIANKLIKYGYNITFLYADCKHIKVVEDSGVSEISLDTDYKDMSVKEADMILQYAKEASVDTIIVDSYYVTNDYLGTLRENLKVICINSMKKMLNADIIINYSMIYDKEFYNNTYGKTSVKLLLGSKYAPLRDEFTDVIYNLRSNVKRVLIMTGGGDRFNFTGDFLNNLINYRRYNDIHFICVSGRYNSHYEELLEYQNRIPGLNIISEADNVSELMSDCDLIITAGGTTLYELGAVGIPALVFSLAKDQISDSKYLEGIGAITYAGIIGEEGFWDRLYESFELMVNSYSVRLNQSAIMKRISDGRGTERICDSIMEYYR